MAPMRGLIFIFLTTTTRSSIPRRGHWNMRVLGRRASMPSPGRFTRDLQRRRDPYHPSQRPAIVQFRLYYEIDYRVFTDGIVHQAELATDSLILSGQQ